METVINLLIFQIGWFPKSYVKLIGGPAASSASNSLTNSPSMTPTSSLEMSRDSPSLDKKDTGIPIIMIHSYSLKYSVRYPRENSVDLDQIASLQSF